MAARNLLWAVELPQLLVDALPDAFLNPGSMAALLFVKGMLMGDLGIVG